MVDIVLYDCFARPESEHDEISVLVRNPRARRVAVYTWNFDPDLIDSARKQGVHGYLSKGCPGDARGFPSRPTNCVRKPSVLRRRS